MLDEMVKSIRETEDLLGSNNRVLCKEEFDARQFKRRKLIINNNIKAGSTIKNSDIICLQTKDNTGIQCINKDQIIGKIINKNANTGYILDEKDFE